MNDSLTVSIHDNYPADLYHQDAITDTPTLSASIANILVNRSPAHARAAHPKLNPGLERIEESKFDLGTAAHAILLQGDDIIEELDYPDWRTNDSKLARDEARTAGRIPLLAAQATNVRAMVAAARDGIASHTARPPLFTNGKPEQTLIWEDDHGVICRARLDWLHDDYTAIDDYKSCSASADPSKWQRTMYGIGCDVQVCLYRRGVERLTRATPDFRYVVQETYPPYALSVVELAPSALALGDAKVQKAIDLWAECLERDEWPAYGSRVASIDVAVFEELQWLEKEAAA